MPKLKRAPLGWRLRPGASAGRRPHPRPRLRRSVSIGRTIGIVLVALVAGCGGSAKPLNREPDEYTGCGTDELWQAFDEHETAPTVSADQAPQLTTPQTTSAAMPVAARPTFAWRRDAADPGMAAGDVAYMNGPGCMDCCPQFNTGALATLHLPPVSGDTYDLQLFIGGSIAYRVITTLQEWAPPDAVWASWRGQTVQLKIYRMAVEDNAVTAGPFVGPQPVRFEVGS